jgi:hypothetical protein
MNKLIEVVDLMTPRERRQEALEIDVREEIGLKVGYYLMRNDGTLRVEVRPSNGDEMPFGIKVLAREIGNDVYHHPYAYLGQMAVKVAILDSALRAA